MKALSDVPLSERDDYLADLGDLLDKNQITEEEAADLIFGPDPWSAWVASQIGAQR